MNIAITGGTGFVGTYVANYLRKEGHKIVLLGRRDLSQTDDNLKGMLDEVEIVINLAGAPIIVRWTKKNKENIYKSRIDTTIKLLNAINTEKTKLIISASAIGIYTSAGKHTEQQNDYGDDFLARVCMQWEKEALRHSEKIRTVIFRFGVVLGDGGALKKMLPLFKVGLGGKIGKGKQAYSWIHIDDLARAIAFVLDNPNSNTTYNLTSPSPSTNREFTKILAAVLKRPAVLSIPEFVLKILYGKGASVLTGGQCVLPQQLLNEGFVFRFPELKNALQDIINPKH